MKRYLRSCFLTLLVGLLAVLSLQSFGQTTGTWTKKADVPGDSRYGAVAFSIGNNGYIGTGSSGARRKDFWLYNSNTGVWTQKANLGDTTGRTSASMERVYATSFSIGLKGYILCGDNGNSINGGATNDVWEYDPITNTWTPKAIFPGVPRFGAVGFSIGSKGYIGTGHLNPAILDPGFRTNDFWEFDPNAGIKGTWIQKSSVGGPARAYAAGFSIGNKGYIGTGNTAYSVKVKDFWEYDPISDHWTQKADFGGLARFNGIGLSIGNFGYIGTGDIGGTAKYTNDFWEYNLGQNIWVQKNNLIDSISTSSAAFSIGNKGYIGTGTYGKKGGVYSKVFLEFTPSATWSGATDTIWDKNSNWQSGYIPDALTDVTIPAVSHYPTISGSVLCNKLIIKPGAKLTIGAGYSLTVRDTIFNSAGNQGLVIKSTALGTGSLIHSKGIVPSTIERYITGDWSAANSGWHFISSPVANQAIPAIATSGGGNGYDFYGWNEPANLWVNYKAGAFVAWNGGSNFNIGQGYMISYQVNQTKIFTGNITVGNVTKTNLTRTAGGSNYSWHLLGNPFSSAIKWNDGNWALNNVAGEAKIWNGAAKSYTDIAANGIIPSAQGFMISVNQNSNSITIPAASRTHNNAFYKSSEEPRILLVASEKGGNSFQESQILINPSATPGFDFDYDSRFLAGYAPQFYSVFDNEMLSTNSVPSISEIEIIPFSFVKNQSDTFNIELKETIGTQPVYLTDLKTDSIQNLSINPVYTFTSMEGDDPARFILHFLDNYTQVPEFINQESFIIEQRNGNITIITLKAVSAEIVVSNMLGQVVLQSKTNGNTSTSFSAGNLPNGVYIVSLRSDKKVASKKIVIRK